MSEFDEVEPSSMTDRTEYILKGGKWAKVVIKGIGDSTETTAGNRFYVTRGYNLMSREEINGSNGWSSGEQVIVRPEYSTIYSEHPFYVPIIRDGNSLIYVKDDQGTDYTASLSGSAGNSSQRVEYVDVMDILKRELSASSGTLTYRTTSDTADEITFNVGCETKYDTIPVMYLNRYGVWETLFMSKKKTRTMTYNRVNYKRSAFVDS
ncbi:MAG: hypothetical protein SVK08_13520, partial [Halobacteriota archaeon]|nr:hypothetical protein [Halobacteriota archaeon]